LLGVGVWGGDRVGVGRRHLGLILDSDGLGLDLLALNVDAKLELGLGLGSTVELLVHGGVVLLEQDVAGAGVGVALDEDDGVIGNLEEVADL
jgi:hypothetical protein